MTDTTASIAGAARFDPHRTPAAGPAAGPFGTDFWGADGFTFGDLLDLINPLRHVPIVSTLYRSATGDDISPGASIAGGGLFGGVFGLVSAVVNVMLKEATGSDIGERVVALFDGDDAAPPDRTAPTQAPSALAEARRVAPLDRDERRRVLAVNRISPAPQAPAPRTITDTQEIAPLDRDERRRVLAVNRIPPAPQAPAPRTVFDAQEIAPLDRDERRRVLAVNRMHPPADAAKARAGAASGAPHPAAWLAAMPRTESDFTALAARHMAPGTGNQILQTVGAAVESDMLIRMAAERYAQRSSTAEGRSASVDRVL